MKRTALAVSVCIGMAPVEALAFDWSLRTTQSETLELNSNQFLRTTPSPSVGSYSTITTNAEARTPTSKFDFDADGTYRKYWGPGVDGIPSESLNYGFKARYEASGKTGFDREFIESAWRQQSTSLALLSQLGVVLPVNGFLDTLTASGGVDRALTARDTLSLFGTSTRTTYEPSSGGTPLTDTLARANWRHNFSSITTGVITSEAELLNYDNATNTRIQIYRNQLGIDATLSPVLSFRGNVGAINLITEGGSNPLAASGSTSSSSSLLDWIGDAALTYRMLKNTTISILASQSIGPSVVGSLFKSDTVSASLSHIINSNSSLSFLTSASRQIATTTSDSVSASATYSYSFTRELSAQLSYRYLHRFATRGGGSIFDPITGFPTVSGVGPADSNSIMLVVSNSYTVLPRGQ